MRRAAALAVVLLIAGCSSAAGPPATYRPSEAPAVATVSDVGNERPDVSYDGLMVRRRVAVAFHLHRDASASVVRRAVHRAADETGWDVRDVPPGVLDATLLEHLVPEVVILFPQNATTIDADRVLRSESIRSVDHTHTEEVLVHDLRISARTERPRAARRAVDREGILTDLFGRYATSLRPHGIDVLYTGPLLGNELVEDAVETVRRAAGSAASVGPRTDRGAGVDMSKEPRPDPVPEVIPTHSSH